MEMASATSLVATLFFLRTILNDFIPSQLQEYISNMFDSLFSRLTFKLNITIHEFEGKFRGPMYKAAQTYLSTKHNPSVHCIRVSKKDDDDDSDELEVNISHGQEVVDVYEGIKFKWYSTFKKVLPANPNYRQGDENDESAVAFEDKFFVLTFRKKYKDVALKSYLPFVLSRAKAIREESKTLRLYSNFFGNWECVNLRHPATFKSLAMDSEMKREVMEDLARFVKRKEYYKRVGKAWKRGYLLYGPPGTGKSSLIAAMANHLRYDIFDLELTQVSNNVELRALLVGTTNRSILVVEDIDCTVDVGPRENKSESKGKKDANSESENEKLTLSGLLNFADGLWSSCGDERIIVFTTNHKDKLDPALLRPGRMDMHIHMGYCTAAGFRVLASNYHSLDDHPLFWEIEGLIEEVQIAPAEVAGELMRSDDAEVALQGLIKVLERKKMEAADEVIEEGEKEQVDVAEEGEKERVDG